MRNSGDVGGWRRGCWAALLLVPVVLLVLIGESRARTAADDARRRFEQQSAALVERLAVRADAVTYVRGRVLAVMATFRRQGKRATLYNVLTQLRRLSPECAVEAFRFDGRGDLVETWPEKAPNQWLMRQLFRGVTLDDAPARVQIGRQLNRIIPQNLGLGKTLGSFALRRGRVVAVQMAGGDGWLAWERGPGWGVIITVRAIPDSTQRLLAAMRRERIHRRTAAAMVVGGGESVAGRWRVWGQAEPGAARQAWHAVQRTGSDAGEHAGQYWVFRTTAAGQIFFGGLPIPAEAKIPATTAGRLAALVVWLAVVRRLVWSRDRLGSLHGVSTAVFLLAALAPAGALVIGASELVAEREQVLGNQVTRFQNAAVQELDARFVLHLHQAGLQMRRLTGDPVLAQVGPGVASVAAALLPPGVGGWFELRNPDGQRVFATETETGGFHSLMGVFSHIALEKWAPVRLREARTRPDEFVAGMIRHRHIGFGFMANYPRYLHPITTGEERSFLFWNCFDRPNTAAALVAMLVPREHLIRSFLAGQLEQRFFLMDAPVRLAAFNIGTAAWVGADRRGWDRALSSIAWATAIMQYPHAGQVTLDGEKYWYSCVRAAGIDDHCLLALFPEATLARRLAGLRRVIGGGLLLALCLAWLMGRQLSTRLLVPVHGLAAGVEALRRRQFTQVVPIIHDDELGRLAGAFNAMVVELREYDVARAVQTGLLPQSYPAIEGYDVLGRTTFASDLGGDCLDCRTLADGRLLFLVGDVAGHGVGSALIMAFVKATVTLWLAEPRPDLGRLGQALDRLLADLGGTQRPFLAMFCGLLAPATGAISCIACGHPYPMLRRESGRVEAVGRAAYPLGSRRRAWVPETIDGQLRPGDTLVCYTDGLVEGRDRDGRELGYDGLAAWLAGVDGGLGAVALTEQLSAFHEGRCVGAVDDVTVLAIHRQSAPSPEIGSEGRP